MVKSGPRVSQVRLVSRGCVVSRVLLVSRGCVASLVRPGRVVQLGDAELPVQLVRLVRLVRWV